MKRMLLITVTVSISVLFVSCGGNNKKQFTHVSSEDTIQSALKSYDALDPYTCILNFYRSFSLSDFSDSFGYNYVGRFPNSNGGEDYIITKNCQYVRESRQYTGIGDDSAAICISTDNYIKSGSLWQFTKSIVERDAVFDKLIKQNFTKESLGNNMYHFDNGVLGIDCQLDNNVWIFTSTVYGDEEYSFIKAKTFDEYKNLITNQVKFEKDYVGKRFKIRGRITRIGEDAFDSRYVEYSLAEGVFFDVRVPASEAYYDLNLPTDLTISGIVTSASSGTLNLKDVYFYSIDRKEYLGYNQPRHKTKTQLDAPKIYEKYSGLEGVTIEPKVADNGDSRLKVTKVTLTDEETILEFFSDAKMSDSDGYYEWCCIDPNAYIIANGQRYTLTRAEGIEKSPGRTTYPKLTMSLDFKLYFPAIPKSTKVIDFSETGDSSWSVSGIELNVPNSEQEADYEFTGYLTDGSTKYKIEMKLYSLEDYKIEGYYRYLSQSKDKKIPVEGEIGIGTGVFAYSDYFYLLTSDGTERFDFDYDIEDNKASGTWKKYASAEDCEWAEDNYVKKLQLILTKR